MSQVEIWPEKATSSQIRCISSEQERRRRRYASNLEKENEKGRRWRNANLEKVKERGKRYYLANQEKLKEKGRRYYASNREERRVAGNRYKEENREKGKEYGKRYREANREKIKNYYAVNREELAKKARRYREANPHLSWAKGTVGGHKRLGFIIGTTICALTEFAKTVLVCPYCDGSLLWGPKKRTVKNSPSWDRVDNSKKSVPLTLENTRIICYRCNTTKHDRSHAEFVRYCRKVSEKFPE